MSQWKDNRRVRALHEAAHAVVARKFGLAVKTVTIRKGGDGAHVLNESAAYLALTANVATQIQAYEKDAVVAQAGYMADVYEIPHPVDAPDLFDACDDDADIINTRSNVYKIVCLKIDRPFADTKCPVKLGADMRSAMTEVYNLVREKAYALVDQDRRAIGRVAKHLERHGKIDGQAALDDLIARARPAFASSLCLFRSR